MTLHHVAANASFGVYQTSLPGLTACTGALLILSILSICVYRVTFHPLAKYPGPLLAKLTDLYATYHASRGNFHLDSHRCHLKYGMIVRYGPNKLLFNTVRGMKDIYGPGKHLRKSKGYAVLHLEGGFSSSVTCINKTQHGRKRRIVSRGLSHSAIRAFEPTMAKAVDTLCGEIMRQNETVSLEGWSEPKCMSTLLPYLTFDIVGLFAFGKSFDILTSPINRYIPALVTAATRRNFVYAQMPSLALLRLEKLFCSSATKAAESFLELTRSMAEDRQRRQSFEGDDIEQRDLFSFIINEVDPLTSLKFNPGEIWAEAKSLLIAGSDTTSTGLASTLFYLTRTQPHELLSPLQLVTTEILTSFPGGLSNITITNPALKKCIYLRACIEEAMRISPPASTAMWREVERAPEAVYIEGRRIPAGTEVGTAIYALHHNEHYFPDSFRFDPSRWVLSPKNTTEQIEHRRKALLTFQYGPRSCAGKDFALCEMELVLARLIYLFELRAASGELGQVGQGGKSEDWGRHRPGELQLSSHITAVIDGPWLEFRKRT